MLYLGEVSCMILTTARPLPSFRKQNESLNKMHDLHMLGRPGPGCCVAEARCLRLSATAQHGAHLSGSCLCRPIYPIP
mgnify:CR=1 FL=1